MKANPDFSVRGGRISRVHQVGRRNYLAVSAVLGHTRGVRTAIAAADDYSTNGPQKDLEDLYDAAGATVLMNTRDAGTLRMLAIGTGATWASLTASWSLWGRTHGGVWIPVRHFGTSGAPIAIDKLLRTVTGGAPTVEYIPDMLDSELAVEAPGFSAFAVEVTSLTADDDETLSLYFSAD